MLYITMLTKKDFFLMFTCKQQIMCFWFKNTKFKMLRII